MDPEPLLGIGADEFFDRNGVKRGRIDNVFLDVTGSADGFDQFSDHDAIPVSPPYATHRNNECIRAQSEHRDGASGAGEVPEEGNKHSVSLQGIDVNEETEVAASVKDGESFQY